MALMPTNRPPTHPGEMLREEFLKPYGITQEELAGMLSVAFQTVNRLVNRRQSLTTEMALRLEQLFGMSADFWLDLQRNWDLWHERQALEGALRGIKRLRRSSGVMGLHPSSTKLRKPPRRRG